MSIRRPELANAAALNAPYPGPEAGEGEASAINLGEFFALLAARWQVIALSVLACLAIGTLIVLATPKTYTATVSILLDVTPRAPPGSEAAAPQGAPDSTLIDTQVRLFASDAVLRRVAQQENLGEDPEFVSTLPGLRARILALFGMTPPAGPDTNRDRISQATGALLRLVTVKRSEKTYVVDVDVSARDPDKAARLANAIAGAYLADQRAARMQLSRRDTAWLNQRITELQSRLREAENRAQEFRAANGLVDANGKNLIEQELADASSEVAKARARVVEAKAKADLMRNALASGRTTEVGDAARLGVLDRLRTQQGDLSRQEANLRTTLGDRHPAVREIQSQIANNKMLVVQEMKRVGDLAQTDHQMAQKAVSEAEKRMDLARETTQRNNQLLVQLRDLERDVEASRDVYQKFLRSREATADDSGGDGLTARVIAPAQVPLVPSAPKTMAIMFVAAAAGFFFGSGGAVAADYFTRTGKRSPQRRTGRDRWQSEDAPEATVIATIPTIPGWRFFLAVAKDFMLRSRADGMRTTGALLREADLRPGSPFAAAFRDVYAAVQVRPTRRTGRTTTVVLVATLDPGAGASVTASNLAFTAAAAGRSVLLIDGNPDRPALATLVPQGAPANLINLHGTYRPIFHVPGQSGLIDLVPILPDEDELCFRTAQERHYEPIEGINGRYDYVVIDGPVLNGSEEDRELAHAADRIVLVVPDGRQTQVSIGDIAYDLGVPNSKLAGLVVTFPGKAKS